MTLTPQPTLNDGMTNANLFCSGHAFLPDGRLLVAGGHLADSHGLNQVTVYDPAAGTWTPAAVRNNGRWYPTALTLPSGDVLVLGRSYYDPAQPPQVPHNVIPQIWGNGAFTSIAAMPDDAVADLYPRMRVASSGLLYLTSLVQTWSLDTSGTGHGPRSPASSSLADCATVPRPCSTTPTLRRVMAAPPRTRARGLDGAPRAPRVGLALPPALEHPGLPGAGAPGMLAPCSRRRGVIWLI